MLPIKKSMFGLMGMAAVALAAPKIIAYLPNYSTYATFGFYAPAYTGNPPPSVLKELTHAMPFSVWPDSVNVTGNLESASFNNIRFTAVADTAHSVGTHANIVLGGWDNDKGYTRAFCTIAKDAAKTKIMASDLKKLIVQNRFDGVDVDWEHPTYDGCSFTNLYNLLKVIKDSLNTVTTTLGNKPELSIAVNPGFANNMTAAASVAQWEALLDWIGLMTYDSPYSSNPTNTDTYLATWANAGFSKSKLILGLPFYSWGGSPANATDTYYKNIFAKAKAAGTPLTATSTTWAGQTFNSITINASLTTRAMTNNGGYGGVMIWDLNQDLWMGDSMSQFRAVKNAFNKAQGISSMIPISSWAPSSAASSSSVPYSSFTQYSCPAGVWTQQKSTKVSAKTTYTDKQNIVHSPDLAIDANPITYWSGASPTSDDWWQIAYTSPVQVSKVEIDFAGSRPAARYRILTSNDSLSWDTVAVQHYNKGTINSSISFTPVTAKYVRYQSIEAWISAIYIGEARVYACGAVSSSSTSSSSVVQTSSSSVSPVLLANGVANVVSNARGLWFNTPSSGSLEVSVVGLDGKRIWSNSQTVLSGSTLLVENLPAGNWQVEYRFQGQKATTNVLIP